MRNILSRLLATGSFDIIVFGDKVLMDEGEYLTVTSLPGVSSLKMSARH